MTWPEFWVSSTCFQKSNISWPQQPPTKKVLKFNVTFHDSTKTFFFQNIIIKLNSRNWMTWKSSVVIFQSQWPQQPQQPQWPQWHRQSHFIKTFTYPDGWIIPGTQMTNKYWPLFVEWIIKTPFSLIYDTLSVGGCWDQPVLLFLKQIKETQMSKPSEATRHLNFKKILILLSLILDSLIWKCKQLFWFLCNSFSHNLYV